MKHKVAMVPLRFHWAKSRRWMTVIAVFVVVITAGAFGDVTMPLNGEVDTRWNTLGAGGFSMVARAASDSSDTALYQNPFRLPDEWFQYGIGDPFILRWNGRYYLYPSTNTHFGGSVGIRAWVSTDLVHWQYAGYVTQHPISRHAYAPEVVYDNGTFYLTTSPGGNGHYIFQSDHPLGPFEPVTDNLGLAIDGSFFVDDDDRWYFTRAGHGAIYGHPMSDPLRVRAGVKLNVDLGGWTEGPYVLKRDGYYYLTYTGNHLLSRGYRVHYAVSEYGPLGPYRIPDDPIVLLSTKKGFSGLGHSMTVLGPNLDAYYIVYHDMPDRTGVHQRRLNIDRLVFNGPKMSVLGPTDFPQPAPQMPAAYDWIDDESTEGTMTWTSFQQPFADIGEATFMLSGERSNSAFTAEYHMIPFPSGGEEADGSAVTGAVFAYVDPRHYAYVAMKPHDTTLTLGAVVGGEHQLWAQVGVAANTDMTAWHTLRVVHTGARLQVFFDNRLKIDVDLSDFSLDDTAVSVDQSALAVGGRIGYVWVSTEPTLSFTAFSHEAGGSSDFAAVKPVPGTIEAVHFQRVSPDIAHDTHCDLPISPPQAHRCESLWPMPDGRWALTFQSPEAWSYAINVSEDGRYGVAAAAMWDDSDVATVRVWVDGEDAGLLTVRRPATIAADKGTAQGTPVKVVAGDIELAAGFHTITLRPESGRVRVTHWELYRIEDVPGMLHASLAEAFTRTFTTDIAGKDGATASRVYRWEVFGPQPWRLTDNGVHTAGSFDTMAVIGDTGWTDYTVQVDIDVTSPRFGGFGGLLVRARDASYYEHQIDDAVIGYFISLQHTLEGGQLALRRLEYDATLVHLVPVNVEPGHHYTLRVTVEGGSIVVYWDDMSEPTMVHRDDNPFVYGAVGLRANTASLRFRNFSVFPTP